MNCSKLKLRIVFVVGVSILFAGCTDSYTERDETYQVIEEESQTVEEPEQEEEFQIAEEIEEEEERHRWWRYDIVQFRDHTLALHPKFADEDLMDLSHNVELRSTFEESVDALLAAVPELTDFEIEVGLQTTVALLQDNHFFFGEDIGTESFFMFLLEERYPLIFGWFADGWYLYQSHEDASDALNHRLIAINDTPLEDVFEAFTTFWSLENIYDARDRFARVLNAPLVLKALGVTDESQTTYTFIDDSEETLEITLTDTTRSTASFAGDDNVLPDEQLTDQRQAGELPLFLQDPPLGQEHYYGFWYDFAEQHSHWYDFIEEDGILYIRFNIYLYPITEDYLIDFEQALQDVFIEYEVEAVIIDARGNSGGDERGFQPLFQWLAEEMPSGRLFYFVNEGSRSGSLLAADYLYQLGAIIVGQPLGQATDFYAWGESTISDPSTWYTYLTYSGRRFSLPNVFHSMHTSEDGVFRPHILIEYTIDDWIYNRDPLYDHVLNLLQ